MLNDILKVFGETFGINVKDLSNINTNDIIDLSTKEGLDKFNKILDQIEGNVFSKVMMESLTGNKIFELRDLAKNYYDVCNKDKSNEKSSSVNKKEIYHSIEEKKIEIKVPERPSSKLTTEQGLKLHKLVQEYVDTMIKPYNNGRLTQEQINDDYAGLYEFASWVLLR